MAPQETTRMLLLAPSQAAALAHIADLHAQASQTRLLRSARAGRRADDAGTAPRARLPVVAGGSLFGRVFGPVFGRMFGPARRWVRARLTTSARAERLERAPGAACTTC